MTARVTLNLWKQNLRAVPPDVWEHTAVEILILADNGLTELSSDISRLQALRTLDLGHNQLATLPRLEKLDLRWVESLVVPAWIEALEERGCVVYR